MTQDENGQPLSGVTYNVYRSEDPYFTSGGAPYDTTGDTTYTDSGVLAGSAANYYYTVTAVDGSGQESDVPAGVAFFQYATVPGSAP